MRRPGASVTRGVFMGLGYRLMKQGARVWWGAEPNDRNMRVERVFFSARGDREFSIELHGWRCGELVFSWGGLPATFDRQTKSAPIHPLGYGVYVLPGQTIEFDVVFTGPGRALEAAAGCYGVSDDLEPDREGGRSNSGPVCLVCGVSPCLGHPRS